VNSVSCHAIVLFLLKPPNLTLVENHLNARVSITACRPVKTDDGSAGCNGYSTLAVLANLDQQVHPSSNEVGGTHTETSCGRVFPPMGTGLCLDTQICNR